MPRKIMGWRVLILPLFASLTLLSAGCTEHLVRDLIPVQFPASDPTDPCNRQLQALKTDYLYFQTPLVSQAFSQGIENVMRAVAHKVTNKGSSEDIEAALGEFSRDLVAASIRQATKNYLGTVGAERQGSYRKMRSRVGSDAARDSRRLASVRTKIRSLERCRRRQAKDIERRYKRGKLGKKQARSELTGLQEAVRRDNRLIAKLVGDSDDRVVVYSEADQYLVERTKTKRRRPSKGVKRAKKNQQKVKKEQAKLAELDNVIERKKSGIS